MAHFKLIAFSVFALCVSYVLGHGMVLDPPNRSSMWRFFPEEEANYDDTEMFCGGFGVSNYF